MSEKEFNTTIISYRHDLLQLAKKLTGDYDTAQDLVQDTYVHVYMQRNVLMGYYSLKGGMVRILKRTFLNDYHASQRRPLIDRTKDVYESDLTYQYDNGAKEISRIISTLPYALRPSFQLHLKGYMYQEIARKLKMPIGTVKSNVCRARKRTIELLTKDGY
jgi:RNA polymerase sigma-70 factor (ECF subfamily)